VTLALRRERRTTPDGDFIDIDVLDGKPGAPTVILLHGLEGSTSSGYIQLMLRDLAALGWAGLAVNARSCSGEPNLQAASYSSGDYRDLAWLTRSLSGRVFAVGFSLGASVLLNFLANDEGAARLEAAVAVSAPYDLARGARFLDARSLISRAYLHRFLPAMKAKALAKAPNHPGRFEVKAIAAAERIRDFDHLVTAPLFGFSSAEDYYARCSAGPQLPRITTPTLLLSSQDDALAPPVMPADVAKNRVLDVLVTRRGGHVGFVTGSVLQPGFWAEARALRWLQER
jgi:predicted alpha/beta-fold hydrolase